MRGRRFINLLSGSGVEVAPPVERTAFSADPALSGGDTNVNVNFRGIYTLSDFMGAEFRVCIAPGDSGALTSNHVALGRWDGDAAQPNATSALIETMFDGTPGFVNATEMQWSDWTPSGVMSGQPAGTQVVVSFNTGGAGQASTAYAAAPVNSVNFFKASTDAWQDEDVTGYSGVSFNFGVVAIETRGGNPPPVPPADYIPMTFNDPIFARNSTAAVPRVILAGGSVSYWSIEEYTESQAAAFIFQDNTQGSFLAGLSRETVRMGGNTTIQYAYVEAIGEPGGHADTIQVYSPGTRGKTINIRNTYVKGHNTDATAGFFCSDDWGGAVNFENVVFDGAPYGCRVDASPGCRIELTFKNVYFIEGSFGFGDFIFQEVGTGTIAILEWDNVRYATVVDGVVVPGALIPQPAFTPANLTPVFWAEPARGNLFQSNAGTTPATANNDVVGFLPDFSGNAKNYTSTADNTTRPTLQGVGAKPCIRFDGVDDLLRRTESLGLLAAPGYTVALAIKGNAPAADARMFAEGNSATNNTLFVPAQSGNPTATNANVLYRNDAGVQLVNPASMLNAGVFNGGDFVLIITGDGSFVRSYVNGVAGASTGWVPSGVFTLNRSCIGALLRAAASNWFAFDLYGIVAIKRVITAPERAALTSYMGNLAGLSL